jgi:hypothetical protein
MYDRLKSGILLDMRLYSRARLSSHSGRNAIFTFLCLLATLVKDFQLVFLDSMLCDPCLVDANTVLRKELGSLPQVSAALEQDS